MAVTTSSRRNRGEVQAAVLAFLAAAPPGQRFTPYAIGRHLGLSVGTVTAACHTLATSEQLQVYGTSPFLVGARDDFAA